MGPIQDALSVLKDSFHLLEWFGSEYIFWQCFLPMRRTCCCCCQQHFDFLVGCSASWSSAFCLVSSIAYKEKKRADCVLDSREYEGHFGEEKGVMKK